MKFFLPKATDDEQAERVYAGIKAFVEQECGPTLAHRYYSIHYPYKGKDISVKVGEYDQYEKELVIAIFRSASESGPFYICTANRGVAEGLPIYAPGDAGAVLFDD